MKLDSEEQRERLMKLISQVPVRTTIGQLLSGPATDLVQLVQAIETAELEPSGQVVGGIEPENEVRKEKGLIGANPVENPVDEPPERDTSEG